MIEDIRNYLSYPSGVCQGFFAVNGINFFVVYIVGHLNGIYEVYPEGQDIAVVNGIDNGICMQLFSKGLLCSPEERIACGTCV
ncbi:hypothetical protein SDC9_130340 [bioreactor metagenome]|uniref:Uncharacterized protein n=1 Tax=bioreactor metagenome TaxID=1076179 RepID=A0A645D296_9ZZZZ